MLTRLHFYNNIGSHVSITYFFNGDMILVGAHSTPNLINAIRKEMNLVGINKITTFFIPDYTDNFCGTYREFDSILKEFNPTYVILPEDKTNPRKAIQFQSCLKDFQKGNHFVVSREYRTSVRFLQSSESGFLLLYPMVVGGQHVFKALRIGVMGLMKRTLLIEPQNITSCRSNNIFLNADAVINLTPTDHIFWNRAASICSSIKSNLLIKYPVINTNVRFFSFWNLISGVKNKWTKYIKDKDIILMKEDVYKISVYELDQSTGLIENRNTLTPNQ